MTITLTREEAQQVLDCLAFSSINLADEMTKTLRERLAQPEPPCKTGSQCIGGKCPQCAVDEPEPVAWMNHEGTGALCVAGGMDIPDWKHLFPTPLYTAPPKSERVYCGCGDGIVPDDGAECGICVSLRKRKWVGLTDEEIRWVPKGGTFYDFAHAIEAKLKEKNT